MNFMQDFYLFPWKDKAIALISWGIFYLFARIFFKWWLFQDYEVKTKTTQLLFSLSFIFSFSLFEIVLFEVIDIMQVTSRQWIWRIDLLAMTYLLVLILPMSLFYTTAREFGFKRNKAILCCGICLNIYLYGFWKLGVFIENEQLSTNSIGIFSIQNFVSRTSLLGVVIIAALSGFGAVNCPHEYLSIFWKRIGDEEIQFLENRLRHNIEILIAKRKRLVTEMKLQLEQQDVRRQSSSISVFSRISQVFYKATRGPSSTESYVKTLRAEISTLEDLGRELFLEIHDMRDHQHRSLRAHTFRGRIFNLFGYVLSVFCVYKMIMSTVNVLFRVNREKDPITNVIEKLLFVWPTLSLWINIGLISELASLSFIGILVFTQTRGFLLNLVKFFRTWASIVSSNSIVLSLAQLMGMYFVSSFVLMRTNLSSLHRNRIDQVLGDIDFNLFHRYFDIVFVLSTIASVAVLVLLKYSKASRIATGEYSSQDKYP